MKTQKRSIRKKPAFLAAFRACGSVKEAARVIGIDRGEHYDWLRKDSGYAADFETAQSDASRELEHQARTSARVRKKNPYAKDEAASRAAALRRDGKVCRVCGFAAYVNVHHIVSRREGGASTVANLITLCPNDHALAHLGQLTKEALMALITESP